jgi:3-phenylpropionate/trans-cinnamate dioxygenase ferredoxin reductase component
VNTVRRVVVIGGGVAGAAAAAELRRSGFDGRVTLVCAEETVPYERPPLSKEFLLDPSATATPARAADWYPGHDVDLLLGAAAESIDPRARVVGLAGGGSLPFDRLLIATGVRPRELPGMAGQRVCYLRTVGDAERLRDQMAAAGHVVVLGGGFIGCEVAAAAIRLGKRATILEAMPGLLPRAMSPALGAVVAGIHRDKGADVRTGQAVTGVRHGAASVTVLTGAGAIECDLLVVGVGTVPVTELAERAGLAVRNGIEVDECCATSVPGIYAAGDAAIQYLPSLGRAVRVEHHDSAIRQGQAAARCIAGAADAFREVHWFWSDQYEHSIQSAGIGDGGPGYVLRGSLEDRSFSAFTLDRDRIRSVISLNRPGDVLAARRLIGTDHSVTAAQLRDETFPLKQLARPRRAAAHT